VSVDCDTDAEDRVPVDAGLGLDPTPEEVTTWLVDPESDEPGAEWSLRCDNSVHGAVVRGLVQYVWTVGSRALGRILRFNRVMGEHADTGDERVDYPVAVVMGEQGEGRYASPARNPTIVTAASPAQRAMTSPGIVANPRQPVRFTEPGSGDILGLSWASVYTFEQLLVSITCGSKPERDAMAKAMEDASNPHVSSGGVHLRLGHYYGAVAVYTLQSQVRPDSPADAASDAWVATFRYRVECPTIRAHRIASADPRAQVSVT
jgi:hypothetical protein